MGWVTAPGAVMAISLALMRANPLLLQKITRPVVVSPGRSGRQATRRRALGRQLPRRPLTSCPSHIAGR